MSRLDRLWRIQARAFRAMVSAEGVRADPTTVHGVRAIRERKRARARVRRVESVIVRAMLRRPRLTEGPA